ncbi:c-type cytochrome [Tunicatimonas pelagia]|uniref:c-type cytochrome n=1 Tax=Tunicatimonas pelagia TaxID=931531 RepID=UPI00266674B4|nr:c-type cytochrome [Tunicatimonas pelagia]WKN44397.1 cytochrome c3 family protein [Tunicatimonas pelagia]
MNDCCSKLQRFAFLTCILFSLTFLTLSWSTALAQDAAADTTAAATEDAAPAEASGGDDGSGIPSSPEAIAEGESIFNNNCTVCHAINQQVVGPALAGVEQRWDDLGTLVAFIKNSQKVIQGGDEYAVNLYNEYNKTLMPAFSDYSDEQILNILGYIKAEASAPAQAEAPVGGGEGGETVVAGGGGIPSGYLTAIIVGLLVVLVLILLVLVLIISVLTRFLNQKQDLDEADREIINQKVDVQKVVKSRPFIGMMLFVFLAITVKLVLDGLFSVGVQQGYQPKQPIPFSHALHAGQYEIECQYCHTGVMKAKSANIPSANICMNCHQQIKTESPHIQKIYAAIDFDPETQTYGNNKKPIEWVRIHNLPDLAYFNHAQHVNVGGLECQTCHGEIQEMEVVYQASELTMGWCINCHRETQVNAKDNAYYDKLLELHNSENPKEPMRVEDIGGLECSKCHY